MSDKFKVGDKVNIIDSGLPPVYIEKVLANHRYLCTDHKSTPWEELECDLSLSHEDPFENA